MAEIQVTTLDDIVDDQDGVLSLREALIVANGNGEADRITFEAALAGGTLTLTGGELSITEAVEIDGDVDADGTRDITIDGADATRLFRVTATAATFENLTLSNGYGGYNEGGGAVLATDGSEVTVSGSKVTGHYGGYNGMGAALLGEDSILRLFESEVSHNHGNFGAVAVTGGTLTIFDSALFENVNTTLGGAVYTSETNLYIAGSSFVNNSAGPFGYGGAISSDGVARVVNSTLTGNTAYRGAAIDATELTLVNSIVTGNDGALSLYANASQPVVQEGANIVDGAIFDGEIQTGTTTTAEIFAAVSNGAGALQNLGGPVREVRLLTDGPAVDGADAALLPLDLFDSDGDGDIAEIASTDSAGRARIQGQGPDLGASELSANAGSAPPRFLTVTTLEDETAAGVDPIVEAADGAGLSLREALAIASAGDGPAVIQFDPDLAGGRVILREGQLTASGTITIDGDLDANGTPDISVNGRGVSRILDWQGGDLTIDGLAFENGRALQGAALRIDQSVTATLEVSNSRFVNNAISPEGYISFGDRRGGAILTHADTHIENALFRNNSAGTYFDSAGGAIFSDTSLTIRDSLFEDNFALNAGGAVGNFGGVLVVEDSAFTGNQSNSGGGGIVVAQTASTPTEGAALTIRNTSFTENVGVTGGAVLTQVTTEIENTQFIRNEANGGLAGDQGRGGGLAALAETGFSENTLHIDGSVFEGNVADGSASGDQPAGGGLLTSGVSAEISDTVFRQNSAYHGGGAVITEGTVSVSSVSGTTFEANTGHLGAGLYVSNYSDRALPVSNSSFVGNYADNRGGGLYSLGATDVSQSTFTGNMAVDGGGALAIPSLTNPDRDGSILLENAVVIGNSSAIYGFVGQSGNNIIGGEIFEGGNDVGDVTVAEVFAEVSDGAGVLGDNGGAVQTVALLEGGAAEDRGDTAQIPADILDLDGDGDVAEALPLDARGALRLAGKAVDLGAFEVQREAPRGGNGADVIGGFENDETLVGGLGDDTIFGGGGDDVLIGGGGADRLNGGAGSDTASYAFAGTGVKADLAGIVQGTASAAGDSFVSVENLRGTGVDDRLRGTSVDNVLEGLGGTDTLFGRGGDDSLLGGAGSDSLAGNAGQDLLTGGEGADTFGLFSAQDSEVGVTRRDIVTDFTQGEDVIDLSRLDPTLDFLGTGQFTGMAAGIRFFTDAGNQRTIVQGDADGDGAQDFQIELTGILSLTVSDFLL
ncbi:MAG: choice-of-anchor Q domain-containing protein [Pseudomonadota bacterium]